MKRLRRFLFLALAAAMCAIMCVSTPIHAAAEDGKKQYIEDIVVAYGANFTEAKSNLNKIGERNGKTYYPLNDRCSFNEFNDGSGQYVLVGYSITNDKQEAITDIAMMNMLGNFDFDDEYSKILQEQKQNIQKQVEQMMPAFELFADNVKEAKEANKDSLAVLAYQVLDKYYNDDIIDSDTNKPVTVAKMITNIDDYTEEQINDMFMQMSGLAYVTIQKYVFMGCIENWVDSLKDVPADANYTAQDYEKAQILLQLMDEFQENIVKYKANGISYQSPKEAIENYLQNMTSIEDKQFFVKYATADEAMRQIKINDTTLYDLFMQDTKDENVIKSLLPVVYCIGKDYSCLFGITDLAEFFYLGYSAGKDISEVRQKLNLDVLTEASVYAGVDRSLYNVEGIAVTNSASSTMNSTNTTLYDQYEKDKEQAFSLRLGFFIGGIAALAIGCTFIVQGVKVISAALEVAAEVTEVSASVAAEAATGVSTTSVPFLTGTVAGGAVLIVIGVAFIAIFSTLLAFMIIKSIRVKEEKTQLKNIPRVIVDALDGTDGVKRLIYYYCVKDMNGNNADLNLATIGKDRNEQWNALYYTKDYRAGNPLTAETIKVSNISTDVELTDVFMPVHHFGETAPYNVNSYNGNEKNIETYFGFSRDDTPKDASIEKKIPNATALFTRQSALLGTVGLALGIGITLGAVFLVSIKKKKDKASN